MTDDLTARIAEILSPWIIFPPSGHDYRTITERRTYLAAQHADEVTLTADANVLLLGSPAALDDFTERFGGPSQLLGRAIRWGVVARQYDGIVIAPYQWSRRHSLNWYYGWDCASGCIWNLNAVAGVRDVTAEAVPA